MHRTLPDRRVAATLVAAAAALMLLGGCAAGAGGGAPPSLDPTASDDAGSGGDPTTELGALPQPLPDGEVVGQGLVLDAGVPVLCLGPVLESAPPQCGGLRLAGWDWSSLDGWEEQSNVRWCSYAVQGTWDGETFTATSDPVSLALYDPAPVSTPAAEPGVTEVAALERIADVLRQAMGEALLDAAPVDGRLDATVVFDDGTLQEHVDAVYGPGVVRIVSALQPVQVP
ncbi:hypothetical protein [Agrococcus sp. SGAir0287]|uniref:hypothetical protein n=1 Tax=Agrococcus sp. SGAir0287 TaxID=2070347 RepID=UPI0010CCD72B|nr:hypothetical protein [Agrococcus sp. SGAir0287]QCR18968.1 hypothetical protein C1N71_05490 [Agrococcus sp. SGAir0287]